MLELTQHADNQTMLARRVISKLCCYGLDKPTRSPLQDGHAGTVGYYGIPTLPPSELMNFELGPTTR